ARVSRMEPHTGLTLPLGTLAVRAYLERLRSYRFDDSPFPSLSLNYPSCGPRGRYRALLFVEKQGFSELFARVKLAERYDISPVAHAAGSMHSGQLLRKVGPGALPRQRRGSLLER